jgi:hypothetical protein
MIFKGGKVASTSLSKKEALPATADQSLLKDSTKISLFN